MIRKLNEGDFEEILTVINDGAAAYRGVVPTDRLHDPYMSAQALRGEIAASVAFWGFTDGPEIAGVMGIQDVQDVTLTGQGIGGELLRHLGDLTTRPVLLGTWAAASWAIRFYESNGFRLVSPAVKDRLLARYWTIPQRQVDTSVVLADAQAFAHNIVAG